MTEIVFLLILFLLSLLGNYGLLVVLRKKSILDKPNARSSHSVPTPHGGGIVVSGLAMISLGIILFYSHTSSALFFIFGSVVISGTLILALLSYFDDLYHVKFWLRLLIHIGVVALSVWILNPQGLLFQGLLPSRLDQILMLLIWVGFLNFYNFMDGIDGMSVVETLALCCAVVLLGHFVSPIADLRLAALSLAAILLGFAFWNWHPARLFLGDVGSIPLGYIMGGLMFYLALNGLWASALILPSYYYFDSGVTLMRRLLTGAPIFQAHRQHFYQQAVQGRASHGQIAAFIACANCALIALAILALLMPLMALAMAFCLNTALLICLRWIATTKQTI